jgi:hypothetical protein
MQGPDHDTAAARAPGGGDNFGIIGHKGRQLVQAAKGFRPGEKGNQLGDFIIGSSSSPSLSRNRGSDSNSCFCMPASNNDVFSVGIHTTCPLQARLIFFILSPACQTIAVVKMKKKGRFIKTCLLTFFLF